MDNNDNVTDLSSVKNAKADHKAVEEFALTENEQEHIKPLVRKLELAQIASAEHDLQIATMEMIRNDFRNAIVSARKELSDRVTAIATVRGVKPSNYDFDTDTMKFRKKG